MYSSLPLPEGEDILVAAIADNIRKIDWEKERNRRCAAGVDLSHEICVYHLISGNDPECLQREASWAGLPRRG